MKLPTLKYLGKLSTSQFRTKRSSDNIPYDTWCNVHYIQTLILSIPFPCDVKHCIIMFMLCVKTSAAPTLIISVIWTLEGIKHDLWYLNKKLFPEQIKQYRELFISNFQLINTHTSQYSSHHGTLPAKTRRVPGICGEHVGPSQLRGHLQVQDWRKQQYKLWWNWSWTEQDSVMELAVILYILLVFKEPGAQFIQQRVHELIISVTRIQVQQYNK